MNSIAASICSVANTEVPPAAIVLDSLDLYYDPTDPDPGHNTSSQLYDAIDNNNYGIITGTASISNGAVQLSPTNPTADAALITVGPPNTAYQYGATLAATGLTTRKAYTFEIWYKSSSVGAQSLISNYTTSYATFIETTSNGNLSIRERGINSNSGNTSDLTTGPGTDSTTVAPSINVCTGKWVHIVKSCTPTPDLKQRLYVNGVQTHIVARSGNSEQRCVNSTGQMYIGGYPGAYRTCSIGSVRIYIGAALTAEQVRANYLRDSLKYS